MSVRVALYAEGSAEHAGEITQLPAPGEDLDDVHLGAGHVLLRRLVAGQANCPEAAVRFISPLRHRGRTVRGSDLLVPAVLRSLVAFPANRRRPDLAVVLIDEDGRKDRYSLQASLENSVVPAVLAIASPEFEAWLVVDHACLSSTLGISIDPPPQPDGMDPRSAKAFLSEALRRAGREGTNAPLRREIASKCDLSVLQRLKGVETLIKDIGSVLRRS